MDGLLGVAVLLFIVYTIGVSICWVSNGAELSEARRTVQLLTERLSACACEYGKQAPSPQLRQSAGRLRSILSRLGR